MTAPEEIEAQEINKKAEEYYYSTSKGMSVKPPIYIEPLELLRDRLLRSKVFGKNGEFLIDVDTIVYQTLGCGGKLTSGDPKAKRSIRRARSLEQLRNGAQEAVDSLHKKKVPPLEIDIDIPKMEGLKHERSMVEFSFYDILDKCIYLVVMKNEKYERIASILDEICRELDKEHDVELKKHLSQKLKNSLDLLLYSIDRYSENKIGHPIFSRNEFFKILDNLTGGIELKQKQRYLNNYLRYEDLKSLECLNLELYKGLNLFGKGLISPVYPKPNKNAHLRDWVYLYKRLYGFKINLDLPIQNRKRYAMDPHYILNPLFIRYMEKHVEQQRRAFELYKKYNKKIGVPYSRWNNFGFEEIIYQHEDMPRYTDSWGERYICCKQVGSFKKLIDKRVIIQSPAELILRTLLANASFLDYAHIYL